MNFQQYLSNALERHGFTNPITEQDRSSGDDRSKTTAVMIHPSLLIRLLELAHEDLKDDKAIHLVAEKIIEIANDAERVLTMDDYDDIIATVEDDDEGDDEDESDDDEAESDEEDDNSNDEDESDEEDEYIDEQAKPSLKLDKHNCDKIHQLINRRDKHSDGDDHDHVDEQCDKIAKQARVRGDKQSDHTEQ